MGEADDDSRHHRPLRGLGQVGRRSERIRDEIGVDFDHGRLALTGDAARCLAHQCGDVSVEISDTGLAGVFPDHLVQRIVAYMDLIRR